MGVRGIVPGKIFEFCIAVGEFCYIFGEENKLSSPKAGVRDRVSASHLKIIGDSKINRAGRVRRSNRSPNSIESIRDRFD